MTNETSAGDRTGIDPSGWSLRDEEATEYVRAATDEVASIVRSTLGPRGMETLVRTTDRKNDPEFVLTKDAGELIDAIQRGSGFNHPVAALFVDAVDSIQRGLGDGTTAATLLTDELVSRGVELMEQGVHPTNVVLGYSVAANRAGRTLDGLVREVDRDDRGPLLDVARTTFPEDLLPARAESYARMAVDAVAGLEETEAGWLDTDEVKILSRTGEDRSFHRGVVVQRREQREETMEEFEFDWTPVVPDPVYDRTVAVTDREIELAERATPLDAESELGTGKVVRSAGALEAYADGRRQRRAEVAASLADLGVDVLVSQASVDDDLVEAFSDAGVLVVDRVNLPEYDVDRIATATGANVVGRLEDLEPSDLGTVGRLSESRVGDEKWAVFDRCDGGAFTIVVDARTASEAARHERLVRDAVDVVATAATDGQVIPGAGAPAMAIAADLRAFAPSIDSREQLAVEAFADAMAEYTHTLAENMGHDRRAARALRGVHARSESPSPTGIGLDGEPIDAWEAGVVEPRRVFSHAIETARSATEQLLTIDAVCYPNVELEEFSPEMENRS